MISPELPVRRRRKLTAKETARRVGVCERTVRNLLAEERSTYENRATERKQTAGTMRAAGHTWAEIAVAVEGTEWAARALVRRWNEEQKQKQSDFWASPGKAATP